MFRQLFLFAMLLFSLTVSGQLDRDSIADRERRDMFDGVHGRNIHVSLVDLIANPEKYHGDTIQVVGYLNLEFEGDAIYLHKEDCDHGLDQNAFWVSFSDKIAKRPDLKKYSKKYVIIIGTFDMKSHGHMELFAGTIKNIKRLDKWR